MYTYIEKNFIERFFNSFREARDVLKKIESSFLHAALWIMLWLAHSICLCTQFHDAFSTTLAVEAGNVCSVLWSSVEIASGLQTKVLNNQPHGTISSSKKEIPLLYGTEGPFTCSVKSVVISHHGLVESSSHPHPISLNIVVIPSRLRRGMDPPRYIEKIF